VAAKMKGKHRIRNLTLGLGVLLGLYALAGFLLLPWWLERALPEQLVQRMGWQAEVAEVHINPFAVSVDIDGLVARDQAGDLVLAFHQLRMNLSTLQLLQGVLGFQEIRLTEPDVRLDLLADSSVNFVRDWQVANPGAPASAPGPERPELPQMYFEQVVIAGGKLRFRDYTRGQPAEFLVQPLDLSLHDLATWPREETDSRYSLAAALGRQSVEWQGELSLAPVYSRGHFKLTRLQHSTLAHFLAPYLPGQLQDGVVTLESDYELAMGSQLELITRNGRFQLQDLALTLTREDDEPALTLPALVIEGIGFDLAARDLQVGMVSLEQPSLVANRNAAGEIDWLEALPAGPDALVETQPEANRTELPFRWRLQGLELTDGRIQWQDQLPDDPAGIQLADLNLTLGGLSYALEEPVSYRLSSALVSGGQFSANGQFTPAPFTLEAALSGSEILLPVVEPFLRQVATLKVVDGRLGFDGHLDLDNQDKPMTGTFSGAAEVSDLDLRLPGSDSPLLNWKTLRMAPVEFNVNPARLEIGQVVLSDPGLNVVRTTQGLHNLQNIFKSGGSSGEAEPETDVPASTGPGFIFRIDELILEDGAVSYTDRTLNTPFNTALSELSGSLAGITNVPPQQGRVALRGQLAGVAPVSVQGTLGAMGTGETSDIRLALSNLSLPVLSPYFGRHLGYAVDSGKLRLELDYRLAGNRLEASNLVVLERMKLGQAVASDQAIKAPVKLGLALLTDRQGDIEMDLPIRGDLADPEFRVGKVVTSAFVNLLVKAAGSPFSMLASVAELAGLSGEELGRVAFVPGQVELAPGEAGQLVTLAGALRARPELRLDIRGGVEASADGLALLKQRMQAAGEDTSGPAWETAAKAFLGGERVLPPEALGKLAATRGLAVRRLLSDSHDVPAEQLFLLEPARQAALDKQGNVTVQFALDAR